MNRKTVSMIMALMMIFSLSSCGKKDKKEDKDESTAVNVGVYTATAGGISNSVTYTGEIKASDSVSVSAKVSAKAVSVKVSEGDRVKAGQILASLDRTDIKLSYDQALAAYNSAVASYNMTKNSTNERNTTQARQNADAAKTAYDSALLNYEREKELFLQNSAVKLAEQSANDAKTAYERAKDMYDNDTNMTAARNQYQTAKDNFERYTELYSEGAISEVEYTAAKANMENAKAALDAAEINNKAALDGAYSQMVSADENLTRTKTTARAALDAAETALENAKNNLDSANENIALTAVTNEESIKTAQAGVDSARAALRIAENSLNNTNIVSPISGYVASKNISTGQMVSPGVEIFSIKNSNTVDAEIKVTETVIPDVFVGTKARISVRSADISDIEGTVTLVNPVKDERSGMYTVRVTIDNADNRINVGMFADVTLVTKTSEDAVLIPSDALMQDGENMYVYKAEGDTAKKVYVETGIDDGEKVEITEGVIPGDKVIITGKEYLSETNNAIKTVSEE